MHVVPSALSAGQYAGLCDPGAAHAVAETGLLRREREGPGTVWKWIYDNDREIYGQFTPVYMRHGAGALRRLDEESLAEINEIFKVSGGSEMFDTIERHSDRKAREMGYEEGADQQYMMDVFLSNSNEHY